MNQRSRRRRWMIAPCVLLAAQYCRATPQSGKVWRVGLLLSSRRPASLDQSHYAKALQRELHNLGYVEGENIHYELRFAENRSDLLPALAAELVKRPVDLLVTAGTSATRAAQRATTSTPIVFVAGDPVGAGLVASLARPGGNSTGASSLDVELSPKLLELLLVVAPKDAKVAVLVNPDNAAQVRTVELVQEAAKRLAVPLLISGPRSETELEKAFSVMVQQGAGSVLIAPDTLLFSSHIRRIAALATRHRLPSIGGTTEYALGGCLLSYAANPAEMGRSQVNLIDRILRGAKAGELPVEQPTKFDLVINLGAARALGITVPQSLLMRADQVIG